MKRPMLTVAIAAVLAAQTAAQGSDSAKDEVVAAQKRFYEAYQACDAKAMENLVTDDMWYFHSTGGIQHNKAEMLESLTPDCFIEILGATSGAFGSTATRPSSSAISTSRARTRPRWRRS